jgi:hypothetical protein
MSSAEQAAWTPFTVYRPGRGTRPGPVRKEAQEVASFFGSRVLSPMSFNLGRGGSSPGQTTWS